MKAILVAAAMVLISSNAYAGMVCGYMNGYKTSASVNIVTINNQEYKFQVGETEQEALDELYFAAQKSKILDLENEAKDKAKTNNNSSCIFLDKNGKLQGASTGRSFDI